MRSTRWLYAAPYFYLVLWSVYTHTLSLTRLNARLESESESTSHLPSLVGRQCNSLASLSVPACLVINTDMFCVCVFLLASLRFLLWILPFPFTVCFFSTFVANPHPSLSHSLTLSLPRVQDCDGLVILYIFDHLNIIYWSIWWPGSQAVSLSLRLSLCINLSPSLFSSYQYYLCLQYSHMVHIGWWSVRHTSS